MSIQLRSTIPIGHGMGSGAAAAVALVRGICNALDRRLNAEQIAEMAMVAERGFHGTPSGVDTAVVARDEPIYFVKGKGIRGIAVGAGTFHFVVADTGVRGRPPSKWWDAVRTARDKDRASYDSYFWELGSLASVSREILKSGSPVELGLCMNRAHRALQSVGVSSPELDRLVSVALDNGALGAKLSGAGRGGVIVALLQRPQDEDRLVQELLAAGAEKRLQHGAFPKLIPQAALVGSWNRSDMQNSSVDG